MGLKDQASFRAKYGIGLAHPFLNAGAPTNSVTQLGKAVVVASLSTQQTASSMCVRLRTEPAQSHGRSQVPKLEQ
jgi:hypothetical protein